jgi:hypothetical protein
MVHSAGDIAQGIHHGTVLGGLAGTDLPRDIDKSLLFGRGDLTKVLRSHLENVASLVNVIPASDFERNSDAELATILEDRMLITPLALNEAALHAEQHEIEVDISKDPRRNPLRQRGPIFVIGISLSVRIPYTGDDLLWHLRPNQWRDHFPRGVVHPSVAGGPAELEIVAHQPGDEDVSRLRDSLRREADSIRFYLDAQRPQIDEENRRLSDAIQRLLHDRRQRLHTRH